ncbi:MAG TPA: alpha/beta fold hydrolase [Mycobacteriales bacterium]|nr:alpha/beta fold hydrolase [Mycobacteriales bacterium]
MRDEHPIPGADRVVDGVRLHVVRHGTGAGLPLLLLHGFPTSSYLWRDVQRDLEHHHVTYAPDLLGAGRSERPAADRYDLAAQARLLLLWMDAIGLEQVAVAAHDIGGGVAVHLAVQAPERVAALVLVNTALHSDVWLVPEMAAIAAPVLGPVQLQALRVVPGLGRRYLRWQIARGLRAEPLTERELAHYADPLLSAEGAAGTLRLVRALDPDAVHAALLGLRAAVPPTLVLWGEGDPWHSTAYGRRVAADIPGSTYVVVPDAGHFLPEDRPERVAEEISAFLAEIGTPATAGGAQIVGGAQPAAGS